MDISLKKQSVGVVLFLAIGLITIALVSGCKPKQAQAVDVPPVTASATAVSSEEEISSADAAMTKEKFIKEAEERREHLLAEKGDNDDLAKRKSAKEKSVECRFWKQQKETNPSEKTDEKIAKFCNI
jgi:hypothetical protein